MATDDCPDLQALFDRLEVQEHGERAVISLIAADSGAGQWQLRFGSVLIGPEAMSHLSWEEWAHVDQRSDRAVDLSVYGVRHEDWREFELVQDGWRYTRFSCPPAEAADLVADALAHGELKAPAGPPLLVDLGPADAFLQLFPKVDTGTSLLSAQAHRPLVGWFHPQKADAPSQAVRFRRRSVSNRVGTASTLPRSCLDCARRAFGVSQRLLGCSLAGFGATLGSPTREGHDQTCRRLTFCCD